jgi:hypothetical protein
LIEDAFRDALKPKVEEKKEIKIDLGFAFGK